MIKRENRLKKNKQFIYIYKHGEARHTKILSLAYAKTKYSPFKVGFTVSKKVGNSVVRNKVKRRLREQFSSLITCVNQGYNYIFIAREGIASCTFEEIGEALKTLLIKANCYNEKIS